MMDTKFWRQGQPQSREVSQAEIDRAAGLNYINAGPALSAGMKQAGLGTDAANQMVWAQKQAEYDSARRPGVVQIGTDGNATSFADPGLSAMEIDRAAVANAVSSNPSLSRFWDPPEVRAQRMAEQRQQRQAEQAPVNAMGFEGATFGEVNGQQVLVPQAGRYGAFMASTGGQGEMSQERAGQIQAARRQQAAMADQQQFQRDLALKTAPEQVKADASRYGADKRAASDRYVADQNARLAKQKAESEWRKLFDQETSNFNRNLQRAKGDYAKEKRTRDSIRKLAMMAEEGAVGNVVILPDGQQIPKGRVEEYLLTKKNLPTEFGDFNTWAQGRGVNMSPPQMARWQEQQPAAQPAPVEDKPFKSGYTRAQLDSVKDRPTAIARLRQAGDEDAARYLESRG